MKSHAAMFFHDRTVQRQIYGTSTQWTKQGKPAELSEFKEGSFVIVLGHADVFFTPRE